MPIIKKKKWLTPQLIVLIRAKEAANVLTSCKLGVHDNGQWDCYEAENDTEICPTRPPQGPSSYWNICGSFNGDCGWLCNAATSS